MTYFTTRSKITAAGLAWGVLALAAAGPSFAADAPGGPRAAAFEALLSCRGMSDDAQRLACYDAAAGRMGEAEKSGDIVVVDRAQAEETRREAFGFNIPGLSVFDRGEKSRPLDSVSGVVAQARQGPDGKWLVELEGGAAWQQTDAAFLSKKPKPGSKAEIRKATVAGFFMKLDDQPAVRARRVR
jgi:hypothetical protein